MADAWHHLSDALTSGAAFIGIAIAVIGGPGFEPADDWAALFASVIIAFNGFRILRQTVQDLMDRMPGQEIIEPVKQAALSVPDVLAIEKLAVRKSGLNYRATLHVQTWPKTPLDEAHIIGGKVKGAIREAVPAVQYVLVHMEPFEEGGRDGMEGGREKDQGRRDKRRIGQ
jgi:cation diffusion facilitator family transporter